MKRKRTANAKKSTRTRTRTRERQGKVAVIMGSDSDWSVMQAACDQLHMLSIPFEAFVISAHRTPQAMIDFATTASDQGFSVLIAGAGGAAHLPGMLASSTVLPVIGVPVDITRANGIDALFSIAQMPAGVPVATVAIDNAKNAALLAAQILAVSHFDLASRLRKELLKLRAQSKHKVKIANQKVRRNSKVKTSQ